MELENFVILSLEELAAYTDNFSERNYISHFQFGKLYRGKIVWAEWTQYMMVKIWEVPEIYAYVPGDNQRRLMDEVLLLSHEVLINHPGMIKLYGYCYEEDDRLGVVYELKPFDSLFNLIPKESFSWLQRIKVALGFASLLKFLHTKGSFYKPFIVRNLDCAHIVLDEDYNPKLCDFGLISGGIFPDRAIYKGHHVWGCYGYIDIDTLFADEFLDRQDVFAFGVILVNLISKRVYDVEDRHENASAVYEWAYREFAPYYEDLYYEDEPKDDEPKRELKKPKFSLVHQSLASDPDFNPVDGHRISELANDCLAGSASERPTMKQVVRSLLKLKVVKKHADFLGVERMLRSCENGSFITC